jgi:hypothetical protein
MLAGVALYLRNRGESGSAEIELPIGGNDNLTHRETAFMEVANELGFH